MSNKRNLSLSPTSARYLKELVEDDLDQNDEELSMEEKRAGETIIRRLEKLEETWD